MIFIPTKQLLTKQSPSPKIPLSVHQRLCGGLFGDGSLDFQRNCVTGNLSSVRYREKQGSLHLDWVENQQHGLKPLTDHIKKPESKQDSKGYWFAEVRTSRTPELVVYGHAFYEQRKVTNRWKATKRVPVNSGELLDNPLSLAVWVAGDGRPKANGDFTLCTQGFTFDENVFLCEVLRQNFRITCDVKFYSNGKRRYPELYFKKLEGLKLLNLCDQEISNLPTIKHRFFK